MSTTTTTTITTTRATPLSGANPICAGSNHEDLINKIIVGLIFEALRNVNECNEQIPYDGFFSKDILCCVLPFLTSEDRKVVCCVSRYWNQSFTRLSAEELNRALFFRFDSSKKTLVQLAEHFSTYSDITLGQRALIAQTLGSILPDRNTVRSVAEVERLESEALKKINDFVFNLGEMSEKKVAALLQFSEFNKDNSLARHLDCLIRYALLCEQEGDEKGAIMENMKSDLESGWSLEGALSFNIIDKIKGHPKLAAEWATLYFEHGSDSMEEKLYTLYASFSGIINAGFFIECLQPLQVILNEDVAISKRAEYVFLASERLSNVGAKKQFLELVELCCTLAIEENMDVWAEVLYKIMAYNVQESDALRSEIAALVAAKITEKMGDRKDLAPLAIKEGVQGRWLTAFPLVKEYIKMHSAEPVKVTEVVAKTIAAVFTREEGFGNPKNRWKSFFGGCLSLSVPAVLEVTQLCAASLPKDSSEKVKLFDSIAQVLMEQELWEEATEVVTLCADTVSDHIPEKAEMMGNIGCAFIKGFAGFQRVNQMVKLCSNSKAALEKMLSEAKRGWDERVEKLIKEQLSQLRS